MKTVTVPADLTQYPERVARAVTDMRLQMGTSRISLNYREISGQSVPLLLIDFYNAKGKLYTLRYCLPPDTPEGTEQRVSLLLRLTRAGLNEPRHSPVA